MSLLGIKNVESGRDMQEIPQMWFLNEPRPSNDLV